jgi:hypothetical protein
MRRLARSVASVQLAHHLNDKLSIWCAEVFPLSPLANVKERSLLSRVILTHELSDRIVLSV